MNEFDLIKKYFQSAASMQKNASGVQLGIGDDCALVKIPDGKELAISVDTLVADVHFPANANPEEIAQRALRVNLSDLAAMGATPLWFTLALTLPKNSANISEEWVKEFSHGLFDCAREFNIHLIGGDTTSGPLSITLQVMGAIDSKQALKRSNAKLGDAIYVTHFVGDGAAALDIILQPDLAQKISLAQKKYLLDRFYKPEPRIKESQQLINIANAALDISDGLVADLNHICRASHLGAIIQIENLPLSPACIALQGLEQARKSGLCGGDDYELCFTVSADKEAQLIELINTQQIQATKIGKMVQGDKVSCELNGIAFNLSREGYEHFSVEQ